MEALVETSPVGVAVFDARTGALASLNREAKRIVEGLRMPGRSAEELLEVVTCRRADGREVALAEIPLAQQLSNAETVRAEEIVLSVPDGRSVKTLINATPIHAADGEVESVVVTMQDLAPLEELERQRAEFLSMVSHELRTPLISIKGSTATVLGASPAPDPAEMLQFFRVIDGQADQMRALIGDLLDQGRIETGTLSVSTEPAEVAGLVDQARNTFLGAGGGHTVRIDLPEDLPRVLVDPQRIVQILNNLFSNAARHSPESCPISVSAARDSVHVAISVADEGRGVPPDQLPHLFRKHGDVAGGNKRGRRPPVSASAWSSARGWWRRTAAASGPRAGARAGARGSPSPCRWPRSLPLAPRRAARRRSRAPRKTRGRERPSSWSTTTRRCCATSGTRWRRPGTPRC